jgi:excisionase family DNA binding protein
VLLGLVSIIVLFVQRYRPNNRSTPGPAPQPTSAARKGCAVAAQPSGKAPTTYPSYLHTAEVADLLHVSPKTVSRWAKEGKLPFLKTLGGHRRYPEAEIRDLAEGLREETTT